MATSPYLLFAVTFNNIVCTGYVIEAKISSIILSSRGSQAAGCQSHLHHNIILLSLLLSLWVLPCHSISTLCSPRPDMISIPMPLAPRFYPIVIACIDYDLLDFGDNWPGGWWAMVKSRWRICARGPPWCKVVCVMCDTAKIVPVTSSSLDREAPGWSLTPKTLQSVLFSPSRT